MAAYPAVLRESILLLAGEPALPDSLDHIKKLLEIAASSLTLLAVIVGAFWTYWLFIRTRQRNPSANLAHQVEHRGLTDDRVWVRVSVTVQNVSKVLLTLVEATCWVQQVKPADEEILAEIAKAKEPLDEEGLEYKWPLAAGAKKKTWPNGDRQIEPGESDQVHFDFNVGSEVETIIVYSYFENAKMRTRKSELGWRMTSVHDLRRGKGEEDKNGTSGDATSPA
jgi:hypothetical protein